MNLKKGFIFNFMESEWDIEFWNMNDKNDAIGKAK